MEAKKSVGSSFGFHGNLMLLIFCPDLVALVPFLIMRTFQECICAPNLKSSFPNASDNPLSSTVS
jgi:hypothetical protein